VRPRVSMREALRNPALLGDAMGGASRYGWRVLLIAAAGERLTAKERAEFKRLTGRDREPGHMVHEFVAVVGRRSGKSYAMACFLIWIACLCDHSDALAPGEVGLALCISRDQRVAKIILGYVEGVIEAAPLLKTLLVNKIADAIELKNNITIEVRPCSHRTLRGMTCVAIVGDEVAQWYTSTDFAEPDVEVLGALRPSLLTTRGPLLLASSAYAKIGVLYEAWRRDYGPNGDPDVLVCYGTSRDLNPTLPQALIDREIARDPIRNRAEYLSEWRDDIAGFIGRDIVEACIGDHVELAPVPGTNYFIFVDPASGAEGGDSYAFAVAHRFEDQVIVDAVREVRSPFSPSQVIEQVAIPLCKFWNVSAVVGDNYAGQFAKEPFLTAGLQYELAAAHKTALYADPFLSLLNSRKIVLPRNDRLIAQICALERSVQRSGRDQITHPPHGHDDLANAVAGVASLVYASDGYNYNLDSQNDDGLDARGYQAQRFFSMLTTMANAYGGNQMMGNRANLFGSYQSPFRQRFG
jgi:hypothetical protein